MDELALIREFRSDLGTPRSEELRGLAASLEREFGSPRRTPPPIRRWRVGVGLAGALALALVAVFGVSLGGPQQPATAAEVLRDAAEVAALQRPAAAPEIGQFLYTRSENAYMSFVSGIMPPGESNDDGVGFDFMYLEPEVRETWLGPGGAGKLRTTSGPPRFLTKADRIAYERSDIDWGSGTGTTRLGKDTSLTPQGATRLPSAPDALRRYVRNETSGAPRDRIANKLGTIEALLGEHFAPPEVRAELFRIAAELPDVELVGDTRDEIGRAGVAVAVNQPHRGERSELIFDPETSDLLGSRQVATAAQPEEALAERIPPGTITGYDVYIDSAIVDSSSERPPGLSKPDPTRAQATLDENLEGLGGK